MKLTTPALALAGLLLTALAGCGDKGQAGAGPNDTPAPASGPAVPAANVSQVPDTTVIGGKTVPLKSTPDGLKYYDVKVGTGPNPKVGQTVSVQYTGTLLDGTKFDSSYDHGGKPIDFPIGVRAVIRGWDEGVPTMKVGGKRRLVIPGPLAYGPNPPTPTIPPDATLVFDIELVAVK